MALAIVIAVSVGVLTAVLARQAGPHDVVLTNVPKDNLLGLEAVSPGEAKISREEAIASARSAFPRGPLETREVALGRFDDRAVEAMRGKLVWVMSFADVDNLGPVGLSGPFGRDRSCDWTFHYGFVAAAVDAESGEPLWQSMGAFFDPSLPPTYDRPGNSDREYCERLHQRELDQASQSP